MLILDIMRPPTRALKEFIGKFQPNIFADESPDTTNEELLALLPKPYFGGYSA